MTEIHALHALLPTGWAAGVRIAIDESGSIQEIDASGFDADRATSGIVLPGLVNAHTHLELAWCRNPAKGGDGFVPWVQSLRELWPDSVQKGQLQAHALWMKSQGTAAVSDIFGSVDTFEYWSELGVQGLVQREFLGFDPKRMQEALADIQTFHCVQRDGLTLRPAVHAPYSTPPQTLRAALAYRGIGPGSIHLAEDKAELTFLREGSGPFANLMDDMGVDWRWWTAPNATPVGYLEQLGLLGPDTLAVHGCHLTAGDSQRLAATQTPLCLCPRSNRHIHGGLPDVVRLIEDGVRLCLGTDSLASNQDTDVLAEIPVLHQAFPHVPMETWLSMATSTGADILGVSHLGRIAIGCRPGLLLLEDCDTPRHLAHTVAFQRTWLVEPGGPT